MTYLALAAFVIVYGLVSYSALAMSRTLSNRAYRNQALGLAAIAIIIVIFLIGVDFGPPSIQGKEPGTGLTYAILYLGTWMAIDLGFYYYVDASIVAARVTDPLFRDTLRWTRVRVGFWAYDISVASVFSITAAVGSYSYGTGPALVRFLISLPIAIFLFSGAVVLPIAAKRSKDRVLRRQLNWFVAYTISLLLGFILSGYEPVIVLILLVAGGYLLYRSVNSLVPLYSFETSRSPAAS